MHILVDQNVRPLKQPKHKKNQRIMIEIGPLQILVGPKQTQKNWPGDKYAVPTKQ